MFHDTLATLSILVVLLIVQFNIVLVLHDILGPDDDDLG